MDHESLRTASTYLNNLLLARGLLRNGEPVDFVKPSKESRAQIINLVHDLILREDRDKEQRESIAFTTRQLHAEDARKGHEIERLVAKTAESDRAAALAQAAERAAHAELKKAEKAMKSLHDQTTKLKTTLAQIKTQCANDVRKRDLELARLKTHLQGQQRGNRVGMTAPSMTVRKATAEASAPQVGDPEYSLKQETTEFLTQLSQSLSDENDSLIGLIRNALGSLRELLGIPANARIHPDSAVGSMGSQEEVNGKHKSGSNLLNALPISYETLASDMEAALENLKNILTNPNFVPMEEVVSREEEISRLRDDCEHLEIRWRDVMYMFQGWLKRMDTGDTNNILEDMRHGMGLVSPDRERTERKKPDESEQSMVDSETSEIRLPGFDETGPTIFSPPRKSALISSSPKRKRDMLEPPEFFDLRPSTRSGKSAQASPSAGFTRSNQVTAPCPVEHEEDESEQLEVPQMTIAEKLSAAQEEAEQAAAAGADVHEDATGHPSRPAQMPTYGLDGSLDDVAVGKYDDTLGKMQSPIGKRTKIRGRPRKRKSTLSPEELETLICAEEG